VVPKRRILLARSTHHPPLGHRSLINDFKAYFIRHGQPIYENPSPGNVAGGLTTVEEKSLGAIQKGGQATVTQVLRYGAHGYREIAIWKEGVTL
jgi:altronate dehydratase